MAFAASPSATGNEVELQSKSGQPLTRYFPEIVAALLSLKADKFVLDGELIVPVDGKLSFDDLLQRIHPAASRVKCFSNKTPARFVVFDFLVDAKGVSLLERPQHSAGAKLEAFSTTVSGKNKTIVLSRATQDIDVAKGWLKTMRGQLDGIVCKQNRPTLYVQANAPW